MPNVFKLEIGHEFIFQTKPQQGFHGIVKCQVIDFDVPKKLTYTWQGGPLKRPAKVSYRLTSSTQDGTIPCFNHAVLKVS
jgi:hypothetical protein